jgi:L-Ala-D/L-Glu epimerase
MDDTIRKLEFWPVDIPLTDPFVVATGARIVAESIFLRVTLSNGAQGYGEAAPFPEVGGETRETCLLALHRLGKAVLAHSAADYRGIGRMLSEQAPSYPSARCGIETAVIDAHCRTSNIPMWRLWGGSDVRVRETDITIPIADLDKTVALARGWYAKGFRLFKMKVGKDVESDIRRLEAVHRALPEISFIGDGNQGFSRRDCLTFAQGVKTCGGTMVLLEQPVMREDLDSMARNRHSRCGG